MPPDSPGTVVMRQVNEGSGFLQPALAGLRQGIDHIHDGLGYGFSVWMIIHISAELHRLADGNPVRSAQVPVTGLGSIAKFGDKRAGAFALEVDPNWDNRRAGQQGQAGGLGMRRQGSALARAEVAFRKNGDLLSIS